MPKELMLAMPVNQLASLCLTVAYYPSHEHEFYAREIENVEVNQFYIEKFLEEAQFNFGLDEFDFSSHEDFEENAPTLAHLLTKWQPGLCPHIINAMYIDEMGTAKVVASGLEMVEGWTVSKVFRSSGR
jgi:hypothetical protein